MKRHNRSGFVRSWALAAPGLQAETGHLADRVTELILLIDGRQGLQRNTLRPACGPTAMR